MEGDDEWKKQIRGLLCFAVSVDSRLPLIRCLLPFEVSFDSLEEICSPSSLTVVLRPFRTFRMLLPLWTVLKIHYLADRYKVVVVH